MSAVQHSRGPKAFTLIELLCVMAVIGILASLLLPVINQGRARARRAGCINNLREMGVAFQSFAHDHNGQFPMGAPASAGGAAEFTLASYQVAGEFFFSYRFFQPLSNDLVSPRLLACPADTRSPAANFASFNNEHLSYLVGLRAAYSRPNSILAGDRNLTNDYANPSTLLRLQTNRGWRWTSELHQFKGNLLFADGHIEEKGSQAMSGLDPAEFAELALPSLPRVGTRGQTLSNISSANLGISPQGAQPMLVSTMPDNAVKPQSPSSLPNQSKPVSSSPVTRQTQFPSSGLDVQTITSTNAETKPGSTTNAPPRNPSGQPEPGFSFFPAWVGTAHGDPVKTGAWVFFLLLLMIATTVLFLRMRARLQKKPRRKLRIWKRNFTGLFPGD